MKLTQKDIKYMVNECVKKVLKEVEDEQTEIDLSNYPDLNDTDKKIYKIISKDDFGVHSYEAENFLGLPRQEVIDSVAKLYADGLVDYMPETGDWEDDLRWGTNLPLGQWKKDLKYYENLNDRDSEVYELLCHHRPIDEMAKTLGVSEKEIRTSIGKLYSNGVIDFL